MVPDVDRWQYEGNLESNGKLLKARGVRQREVQRRIKKAEEEEEEEEEEKAVVRPNEEGGEKVGGVAWHSLVAKGETMKFRRLMKPVLRFDVGQFDTEMVVSIRVLWTFWSRTNVRSIFNACASTIRYPCPFQSG